MVANPRVILLTAAAWAVTSVGGQTADCRTSAYECAIAHIERHEFDAATRVLEAELERSPRDLKLLNLLGIALTGAGRPAEGSQRFRDALTIDPSFYPARKNLGVNAFNEGRYADARRHFEEVLAHVPDDEIAHVHVAEIHFQAEDCRAARSHYEKSGARVTERPTWILHYATCLLHEARRDAAIALLDELPDDDAASRYEAGVALARAGAHAAAARFFGTARLVSSEPYAAGYNQVLMLIEAGEPDEAIRVGEVLLDHAPKPAELSSLLSRAYVDAGRIEDAYNALRRAARLEPRVDDHYIDLALICLDHENFDLGLEIVDVGLRYRPDSIALHLQHGVLLAMKGHVEQATHAFEQAHERAPNASAPLFALALAWMTAGNANKAVDVLRPRVTAAPTDPMIPYVFGLALIRSGTEPTSGAAEEALQAFRTAVHLDPQLADARTELGKLLVRRGDLPEAIAELEQAVALDPENSAPAYALATAYRSAGDMERARAQIERVRTLLARGHRRDEDGDLKRAMVRIVRKDTSDAPSDNVADAYNLSGRCTNVGDLDGAIELLRHVVASKPRWADARYNLGLNLWNRYKKTAGLRRQADLDEAIKQLEHATTLDPDRALFHFAFGQVLAERGHHERAVESLRRASQLAPENAEYQYNLGLGYRLEGDLTAAEAAFRNVLTTNPDHGLARRALGLVLRRTGDMGRAVRELRIAAARLPDDARSHHVLGAALLKVDKVDEAIESLERAVELDPRLTDARATLAQALSRAGRREEARTQQAALRHLNVDRANAGRAMLLVETGSTLIEKGDVHTAISQLREAVALSPDFPEAHYRLGLALERSSTAPDEAEAAFRRVLALDPRDARAHWALASLLRDRGDTAGAESERRLAIELAPCFAQARGLATSTPVSMAGSIVSRP